MYPLCVQSYFGGSSVEVKSEKTYDEINFEDFGSSISTCRTRDEIPQMWDTLDRGSDSTF